MPIVSMIRIRRVEERKLWILTLVLANFVLELRRVCGARNEQRSPIDNSCNKTDYSNEYDIVNGRTYI
jgi:hypothetical protein